MFSFNAFGSFYMMLKANINFFFGVYFQVRGETLGKGFDAMVPNLVTKIDGVSSLNGFVTPSKVILMFVQKIWLYLFITLVPFLMVLKW
jgi:hypothetical protein